jgi:CheY-like chemotaxis protein
MTSIPEQEWGWRFVGEPWSDIDAGPGSRPNPEGDLRPASQSRSEDAAGRKRRRILIVEDNRADVYLIRESVEAASLDADLRVVSDGDKAIRLLDEIEADPSAFCPDLVVLDINLPKKSGRDVVRRLRQSRRCAHAVIVVVTSSDSERDRSEMAQLGVQAYFRKPSEYASFLKLGDLVRQLLDDTPPHQA